MEMRHQNQRVLFMAHCPQPEDGNIALGTQPKFRIIMDHGKLSLTLFSSSMSRNVPEEKVAECFGSVMGLIANRHW